VARLRRDVELPALEEIEQLRFNRAVAYRDLIRELIGPWMVPN